MKNYLSFWLVTGVSDEYRKNTANLNIEWDKQVSEFFQETGSLPVSQAEVVGAVNGFAGPRDVVVCAAGSLPGRSSQTVENT